eukprot:CAMPEP_0196797130 /NCGR_PEP_ID=MMETSP1104-20130614/38483_1 /TAXON_ID=33652 /ORGANISM="Cafeteria sp., Strain Caron Lab Isolate" /LENGTH=92 /DNA_ID=CAMNT_0042167531 /DNA_START=519 /DNA_END=797 /DNA_ORIENTATION=+
MNGGPGADGVTQDGDVQCVVEDVKARRPPVSQLECVLEDLVTQDGDVQCVVEDVKARRPPVSQLECVLEDLEPGLHLPALLVQRLHLWDGEG